MRQRESRGAAAYGRQLGGKIDEPMGDEVDHLALPLNAALHSDHALATITMRRNFTSLSALTGRSATVVR